MVGAVGIARRVYARFAAEGSDLQTGIVGKAVVAVVLGYVACLLDGVALQGIGGLGYVYVAIDVPERQYLEPVAEDGTYLVELV